jgi:hypothetical protein
MGLRDPSLLAENSELVELFNNAGHHQQSFKGKYKGGIQAGILFDWLKTGTYSRRGIY